MDQHLKFVCHIFGVLANQVIDFHTSDLFIELPCTLETLSSNRDVTLCVRRTGADNINRFRDALSCASHIRREELTDKEALKYCEQTLGWDVLVTLKPNHAIMVEHNDNGNISAIGYSNLVERLKAYGVVL